MIYLIHEKEQFERTKKQFAATFETLLQDMLELFQEKGRIRDVGAPIHHRMTPGEMLGLARTKCRRIEAVTSLDSWEDNTSTRSKVVEECVDAATYLLFMATICTMLEREAAVCK